MLDSSHTAVGPIAGYLFQPDRALVILCKCTSKESVSIELVDDIAVTDEGGQVLRREQAKNTIQKDVETFSKRSKDLWNTLHIWCKGVKDGTIDIKNTKLICVTNVDLDNDSLVKKVGEAKTVEQIQVIVDELKKVGKKPSDTIKDQVSSVLSDDGVLKDVIEQIQVVSGNNFEKRTEEIAESLHLSAATKNNIVETLRGWMHENILRQLETGQAPVISKKDFNEKLSKTVTRETDDRLVILAKTIVKGQIPKEKREEAEYRNFVKQLDLIKHVDKHNIILDAIDDFLCSETERTRLTLKGDLTRQELEIVDDNSKERWKEVFRQKVRQTGSSLSDDQLSDLAFDIYSSTIENYLSKIRGFETEPYFTKGSFHKLADDLQIGWHPNWQILFPNT
jgi:hypothetical protein